MKDWLFRTLFGAESRRLDRLEAENAALRAARRPARIQYAGRIPPGEIAARLAGTRAVPAVAAVLAQLEVAVVAAGDRVGEEPREGYADPRTGVWVPAYTEAMRTHAAGGLDALARFLEELQTLTAAAPGPEQKGNK